MTTKELLIQNLTNTQALAAMGIVFVIAVLLLYTFWVVLSGLLLVRKTMTDAPDAHFWHDRIWENDNGS